MIFHLARPEVCLRHAPGVLDDRRDLDYDTWMRLELVLEDQWIPYMDLYGRFTGKHVFE